MSSQLCDAAGRPASAHAHVPVHDDRAVARWRHCHRHRHPRVRCRNAQEGARRVCSRGWNRRGRVWRWVRYAHGLSNRLTGGPDTTSCLGAAQSGGMGEGWGDWISVVFRYVAGIRTKDLARGGTSMGWLGRPASSDVFPRVSRFSRTRFLASFALVSSGSASASTPRSCALVAFIAAR